MPAPYCKLGTAQESADVWADTAIVKAGETITFNIYFWQQYVFKINTPSTFVLVSVGSDKTDFAQKTFARDESAWDMVQARGLGDDQIMKIWTKQSVLENRLKLFGRYTAALCWALILPF